VYEIELEAPMGKLAVMTDKERPKDFQISYKTTRHFFSSGSPDLTLFIVSWGINLATNMLASYLYDLIKKHSRKNPEKITINRIEITFDKGEIQKVIEEHITREKK
jgi:hypothetical protein